ncbi:MAG: NAD(P)/FAD-dependent oxidoreductase [Leptospiraceae bacterium]|nr:NAD(P)/FAD-dependent oxidoreductase [Leptospiraceae bacterium]
MDTKSYDAIVIGCGLGGLIAAARLARAGKKILMLEQHVVPGGCATVFKRRHFTMEVGLHEMDGLDDADFKREIFAQLDVFQNLEFVPVPEFYRTVTEDGRIDAVIPDNAQKAIQMLQARFPEEGAAINAYFETIHELRCEVARMNAMPKWRFALCLPLFPVIFPRIARLYKKSLGQFLQSITGNAELRQILLTNLGYYHDDPESMSMLYYSMAQGGYYAGGGHYIKGGSQKLADYLVTYIKERGGEILFNQLVTSILVEHGRAGGVAFERRHGRHKNPSAARAKIIIANAAIPNLPDLLPSAEAFRLKRSIAGQQIACSLFSIYVGFKSPPAPADQSCYSTFVAPKVFDDLRQIALNNRAPFHERGFVFVDYSKIDSGLAESPRSVGAFCCVDYLEDWENLDTEAYNARKEAAARHFFDRMERFMPGFKEKIETYEVGTPRTIKHYTMNPAGSAYGFAQIPGQDGIQRIKSKSVVPGLHYASAYTFPGGGFTGAILSGWFAAAGVLKDLR